MQSKYWNICYNFVELVCKDRDPSHGLDHMNRVTNNAKQIFEMLCLKCQLTFDLVVITAFLHDVIDHKYDFDGNLRERTINFLNSIIPEHSQLILNIIDRLSYSKENEAIQLGQKNDWKEVLGEMGCLIRDVVSDADKIEALGKIGLERCIEYSKHAYFQKHGIEIDDRTLKENVRIHADEKLLRLKDEFIRTEAGKRLAEPLHQEFVQELEKQYDNKYYCC